MLLNPFLLSKSFFFALLKVFFNVFRICKDFTSQKACPLPSHHKDKPASRFISEIENWVLMFQVQFKFFGSSNLDGCRAIAWFAA